MTVVYSLGSLVGPGAGVFPGIVGVGLFVLFAVGLVTLLFRVIFPAMIYRADRRQREQDVQAVQATGASLAQMHCSGWIGALRFRGPLLLLTVYPGGLLIKPFGLPPVAIATHTLTAVRPQKSFLGESIAIEHRSETLVSPLRFDCNPKDQAYQCLILMGKSIGALQTT